MSLPCLGPHGASVHECQQQDSPGSVLRMGLQQQSITGELCWNFFLLSPFSVFCLLASRSKVGLSVMVVPPTAKATSR